MFQKLHTVLNNKISSYITLKSSPLYSRCGKKWLRLVLKHRVQLNKYLTAISTTDTDKSIF